MTEISDNVNDDEREKIFEVCEQYLGDVWKRDNISIKRFAKGYFNRIFYCELTKETNNNDRKAVVVKLSLDEDFFLFNPLMATINTLVISEAKIGPKVLGVFQGGTIVEFIKNRSFTEFDYDNPLLVSILGQKLAKFHSLKAPVPSDSTQKWLECVFNGFVDLGIFDCIQNSSNELIGKSHYKILNCKDIKKEIEWIRNSIETTEKILVYSHCDLNRGNILVKQNNQTLDVFLIDFDFSSYNYRGIDFGRYFSSWKHKDPNFGTECYPTDEQMLPLIDAYIEESNRLTGNEFSNNKLNSRQHLIKETKLFTLAGIMIDIMFCLYHALLLKSSNEDFLEKGENRYAFYLSLKEKFQNQNALSNRFD